MWDRNSIMEMPIQKNPPCYSCPRECTIVVNVKYIFLYFVPIFLCSFIISNFDFFTCCLIWGRLSRHVMLNSGSEYSWSRHWPPLCIIGCNFEQLSFTSLCTIFLFLFFAKSVASLNWYALCWIAAQLKPPMVYLLRYGPRDVD